MTVLKRDQKFYYINNHIGLACSVFNGESYKTQCFQELLSLMSEEEFRSTFNYGIYTDDLQVNTNLFLPVFHVYYLNSDSKGIVIMDEKMIDLPSIYDHHKYYVHNNQELYDKLQEKYPNKIIHITSIKDMANVPANE